MGHSTIRFECDVPGCSRVGDRGFTTLSNLRKHKLIMHSEEIALVIPSDVPGDSAIVDAKASPIRLPWLDENAPRPKPSNFESLIGLLTGGRRFVIENRFPCDVPYCKCVGKQAFATRDELIKHKRTFHKITADEEASSRVDGAVKRRGYFVVALGLVTGSGFTIIVVCFRSGN